MPDWIRRPNGEFEAGKAHGGAFGTWLSPRAVAQKGKDAGWIVVMALLCVTTSTVASGVRAVEIWIAMTVNNVGLLIRGIR